LPTISYTPSHIQNTSSYFEKPVDVVVFDHRSLRIIHVSLYFLNNE